MPLSGSYAASVLSLLFQNQVVNDRLFFKDTYKAENPPHCPDFSSLSSSHRGFWMCSGIFSTAVCREQQTLCVI